MPSAHVDLVEVGSVALAPGGAQDTGRAFADTGIELPASGIDALVVRVGTRTSSVFSESRLTGLDRAAAGDAPTAATQLPLQQIGVSTPIETTVLGCSAATAAAPRGTLLVGGVPTRPLQVTLWHLAPADVGVTDLDAAAAQRLVPTPTEATRGRYVRQSVDGETYELTVDAPAADVGDLYATPQQYRARTGAKETAVDDDVLTETFATVARLMDRRLGWAPGALGPITGERTLTFWPGRRPNRVLYLRDAEGHVWPLRSWTSIACDYSGSGTADTTIGASGDVDWVVGLPSDPSRPHRALRILEAHADAVESFWPADPGYVSVTGSGWGHAQVVSAARDLVIHVSRTLLDSTSGGAAAAVRAFDDTIRTIDAAGRLWRLLEMEFSAGRPGRLGVLSSAAGRRR